MKISYNWLCELIPGLKKISFQDLAQKLTMSGLEVEGFESQADFFRQFSVAEVVSLEQHPNADTLHVCQVKTRETICQVVCGAPNVTAGQKYPFAGVGVVLGEGLEIKPVKLRGVDSFGMLCSARELGLSDDHSGLLTLENTACVGETLDKVLGLDDVIFEVNITPNRGDALSHWGIAADVAALTGLTLLWEQRVPPTVSLSAVSKLKRPTVTVTHLDPVGCRRFTASQITHVNIAPSPLWLKNRLESLGIRSINNVVDATNYVMMLTGHPVHAYDANDIAGNEIKIYHLKQDCLYKTLDGVERHLLSGDLVIGDVRGIVGLAGIMGGENSEIKDSTRDLILEVAFFDPDSIRKTSRRLGLQTESSYRFARFVNPDTVQQAHEILRDLIVTLAGGEGTEILDSYPQPFAPAVITVSDQEISRILGILVPRSTVLHIFKGLRCEVKETAAGYVVQPPLSRSDLTRPIDLIEEVARLYGLDNIPAQAPRLQTHFPCERTASVIRPEIKRIFVQHGFAEVLHYSFGEAAFMQKVLRAEDTSHWIRLQNPISEDLAVMRPSHLPSLLQTYQKNRLLTEKGLRFFELRNVYGYEKDKRIVETLKCSFLYAGNAFGRNRFQQERNADFFDGKGLLEAVFHKANINPQIARQDQWPFHPGQAAGFIWNKQTLATWGALHPQLLSDLKIPHSVYYGEINFDILAHYFQKQAKTYKSFSVLPSVYRDLSLVVSADLTYAEIATVITNNKPAHLSHFELFDLFEGESVEKNKKSITISMVYEPTDKSLTDEQVNEAHFLLVETLKKEVGAELR